MSVLTAHVRLIEQVSSTAAIKVDRAAGLIRGVKVLGRVSQHGYEYSPKAMAEAAALYEGCRVNVDHPPRGKGGGIERSVTDCIGELRNTEVRAGGVYADLHYIKSHPFAPQLAESAERFPKQLGMSHVADGDIQPKRGKKIVESVTKVISVDVVARPATNASLFEGQLTGLESRFSVGDGSAAGVGAGETIQQVKSAVSRFLAGMDRAVVRSAKLGKLIVAIADAEAALTKAVQAAEDQLGSDQAGEAGQAGGSGGSSQVSESAGSGTYEQLAAGRNWRQSRLTESGGKPTRPSYAELARDRGWGGGR
jgi:hypothetical protein